MRAWAGRRQNACCGTPMRRWARRPEVWPRDMPVCQAWPLARLRHHVHDRWLAALHDSDGLIKRRAELIWFRNRAKTFDTQGARHGSEVWCRVFDVHPDTLIVNRTFPTHGHAFLMLFVVVV